MRFVGQRLVCHFSGPASVLRVGACVLFRPSWAPAFSLDLSLGIRVCFCPFLVFLSMAFVCVLGLAALGACYIRRRALNVRLLT